MAQKIKKEAGKGYIGGLVLSFLLKSKIITCISYTKSMNV